MRQRSEMGKKHTERHNDRMFIKDKLTDRKLPPLMIMENGHKVESVEEWKQRRREIKEILDNFFAGVVPPLQPKTVGSVEKEDKDAVGGKAIYRHITIQVKTVGGFFSFPCHMVLPKHVEKPPVFLYISFEPELFTELCPVEEIIDRGYALVSFYYQDIAPDTDSRFLSGVARLYNRNPFDSWGTVSMWAWGASRIMDYLLTLGDEINTERIGIVGHSRLGKTSLWCGASDNRFSVVISNNSGGAGTALYRGKQGEQVINLRHGASKYWFCGNFLEYAHHEKFLPFDQHFVMALVAPRYLYVSSSEKDEWADPKSEFLGAAATDEIYEFLHLPGLVAPMDKWPDVPSTFHEGRIGYHIRKGTHYLSRYDWNKFMDYRDLHKC